MSWVWVLGLDLIKNGFDLVNTQTLGAGWVSFMSPGYGFLSYPKSAPVHPLDVRTLLPCGGVLTNLFH
jgi:hypothetical protein